MRVLREGPVKITRTTIDNAWRRREPKTRLLIGDFDCRGLALVVNPTGMSWRFDFKPRGIDATTGRRFATQSITIGSPATHSPEDARAAANGFKGEAKAGEDPAARRRAKILAAALDRSRSVQRLIEEYATNLPKRPRLRGSGKVSDEYVNAEVRRVQAGVADMQAGSKSIHEVSVNDLRTLLRATAAQPGAARHRFGALNRFFDWCCDEGLLAVNPCRLIGKDRRPKPIAARSEFMTPELVAQLWKAAEDLDPVHRDFIRFLMVVPCRRTEAATLHWEHLNLTTSEWKQPAALTKNGDPHRLYLPPLALTILSTRHNAAGNPQNGLVFMAPRSGGVITAFSAFKGTLEAKAGLTGWRIHDFRRSFATALGEAGFSETVVDAVLNHRQSVTRGGVLGVYQRAQRWPEQVSAMRKWGDTLALAIEGRHRSETSAVVPLYNRV